MQISTSDFVTQGHIPESSTINKTQVHWPSSEMNLLLHINSNVQKVENHWSSIIASLPKKIKEAHKNIMVYLRSHKLWGEAQARTHTHTHTHTHKIWSLDLCFFQYMMSALKRLDSSFNVIIKLKSSRELFVRVTCIWKS